MLTFVKYLEILLYFTYNNHNHLNSLYGGQTYGILYKMWQTTG